MTLSCSPASLLLAAIVSAAGAFMPLAAQTSAPAAYHVTHDLKLGGEGRWDYVTLDSVRHRLFIARQTRVMVVDPQTGKLLGEIPGLNGAHGTTLVYPAGHGFATSGRDSSVTMFDLHSLKVLARIKAADDADAVLYDPASRRVFTFNGDAGSSTALDPRSGKVIGSIDLGGKPEFGVSSESGTLYVNIEDKGEVAELDPVKLRVIRRWPLEGCDEPTGLAMDRAHGLLFSVCHSKMMAISDARAGRPSRASRSAAGWTGPPSTPAPASPSPPTATGPSPWCTRTARPPFTWCPPRPPAAARAL